jgi:hypothetical protein
VVLQLYAKITAEYSNFSHFYDLKADTVQYISKNRDFPGKGKVTHGCQGPYEPETIVISDETNFVLACDIYVQHKIFCARLLGLRVDLILIKFNRVHVQLREFKFYRFPRQSMLKRLYG